MARHFAKSLQPERPPLLSRLYGALLDMNSMRATLDEVRHQIASSDAERLRLRLDLLEHAAARLIETIEPPSRFSH
jgi:hypothetical protein